MKANQIAYLATAGCVLMGIAACQPKASSHDASEETRTEDADTENAPTVDETIDGLGMEPLLALPMHDAYMDDATALLDGAHSYPESAGDVELSLIEQDLRHKILSLNLFLQTCGSNDDSQHVELYDGSFGPTKDFVTREQPATARLVWNVDRIKAYPYPTNLSGAACTATLVGEDLLVTAAHCVAPRRTGSLQTPKKIGPNGAEHLKPNEVAKLLDAEFNYQLNGATNMQRTPDSFKVLDLTEDGFDDNGRIINDYAILRIASNAGGQAAGDLYSTADWDASQSRLSSATHLTVIQHPDGDFKKVHAGALTRIAGTEIRYNAIDTLSTSSGSGIIDQGGKLIGVHTHGGCKEYVKYNSGISLASIRNQSAFFGGANP